MSVPKGRRNKSKIEFDNLFFKIAEDAANMVENHFGADDETYETHRLYLDDKSREVLSLVNHILRYIRMANVFPTCRTEYETRRDCMSRAIGLCYSILINYQLVMKRFKIDDNKYVTDIENIWHFINSVKNWRSSDNRFKKQFE